MRPTWSQVGLKFHSKSRLMLKTSKIKKSLKNQWKINDFQGFELPNRSQNPLKIALKNDMHPKKAQDAPKTHPDAPKTPQDTPRTYPRCPKLLPRLPFGGQLASNLAPKTRQDGVRSRPGGIQIEEKWSLEATTLPRSIWTRFLMRFGIDLGGFSKHFWILLTLTRRRTMALKW